MKDSYKSLIYAISSVVIIFPLILIAHNHIYVTSHLEKIEFEEILDYCYVDCKSELESQGHLCKKIHVGYACVPPIDTQQVELRKDYWHFLKPDSYGYLELVYGDRENHIGFLKDVEIIDENRIKATFRADAKTQTMNLESHPEEDYEHVQVMNVGDEFIPRCHNQNIFVYKLHDVIISDDVSYAVFVYRIGNSDVDRCSFPEFLEQSFRMDFEI